MNLQPEDGEQVPAGGHHPQDRRQGRRGTGQGLHAGGAPPHPVAVVRQEAFADRYA
ncbi:MAG: hypothetical protein MZW92_52500 [Comamonadaceae bacterium]|nr:hypothetical protein [Comamonadaceae bacterium]